MKKTIFVSAVIAVVGFATWVWFIEFGGWDAVFDYTTRHPRLFRLKNLLDHPITYYKWRSSMKVFDPLYPQYWYRQKNLKTFDLFISNADLRKLNASLPEPYSSGNLAKENRVKVKGEIVTDGVKKEVKVSYRGNSFNHWSDVKKSWKLEFNTGEELQLILPSDRGYFSESLSNYRAGKLGLLAQNDDWAWLRVNGEDIGVYYMTGGWNEYWLEKSGRQVSQLVGELDYQTGDVIFPVVWDGVWNWKFYAYRTNRKFPNSYYLQQFLNAVNNVGGEQFTQAIGQVVDIESLVRWKALSIINNSSHTNDVHNWRMWLNPDSLKFHIIPVDMAISMTERDPSEKSLIIDRAIDKFSAKIHGSARLTLAVDKALWDYVKDDYQINDDLKYWDGLAERLLPEMYADRKKHYGNISLRKISLMRQKIKSHYEKIRNYLVKEDLRLKVEKIGDTTNLIIFSYQPTQVELESVFVNERKLKLSETLLFSRQAVSREGDTFLFDREPGEIKIPIMCFEDCRIKVAARNLVTGNYQEISL